MSELSLSDSECYFSALALALTLPDACGKAEYRIRDNKKRYEKWCKNFCISDFSDSKYSNDMPYLSEEVIYQLRCSFLHQNTPSVDSNQICEERCKLNADEFILTISDNPFIDNGTSMVAYGHNREITEKKYEISIGYICYLLCSAAVKYYNENKEKFDFFNYSLIDKRIGDNQ